jgi:hypothetical protein
MRHLLRYESVNRIDHLLDRRYFELFVRDFDFELIFDIEHEFDLIKGIETQIFECCLGLKFLNIEIKFIDKEFFQSLDCGHAYLLCGNLKENLDLVLLSG